jgi:hypothetical protein
LRRRGNREGAKGAKETESLVWVPSHLCILAVREGLDRECAKETENMVRVSSRLCVLAVHEGLYREGVKGAEETESLVWVPSRALRLGGETSAPLQ